MIIWSINDRLLFILLLLLLLVWICFLLSVFVKRYEFWQELVIVFADVVLLLALCLFLSGHGYNLGINAI